MSTRESLKEFYRPAAYNIKRNELFHLGVKRFIDPKSAEGIVEEIKERYSDLYKNYRIIEWEKVDVIENFSLNLPGHPKRIYRHSRRLSKDPNSWVPVGVKFYEHPNKVLNKIVKWVVKDKNLDLDIDGRSLEPHRIEVYNKSTYKEL